MSKWISLLLQEKIFLFFSSSSFLFSCIWWKGKNHFQKSFSCVCDCRHCCVCHHSVLHVLFRRKRWRQNDNEQNRFCCKVHFLSDDNTCCPFHTRHSAKGTLWTSHESNLQKNQSIKDNSSKDTMSLIVIHFYALAFFFRFTFSNFNLVLPKYGIFFCITMDRIGVECNK